MSSGLLINRFILTNEGKSLYAQLMTSFSLEMVPRDIISDMFLDVSQNKTLFYFVESFLRDTFPDTFPNVSTKQVMTMTNCIMMFLA